jgi:hypothetical protein
VKAQATPGAAVSEDAVDSNIFSAVDSNNDSRIELGEFVSALGDLGPSGEDFKGLVFRRTDYMGGSGGRLDVTGFASALAIVRNSLLGY